MASQQLQIRAAIAAAILGAGVLPAGLIHQDRDYLLGTGVEKQLHVNFKESAPEEAVLYAGHPIDWESEFDVAVIARKSAGVEAADVADAVWSAAYAALMADQSLGGLADYFEPGAVVVEHAEGDTSICRLTWSLTVHHRTAANVVT